MDHFQQILNHLWSICATLLSVLHSLLHPWKALNHPNSFREGMLKLNAKSDANPLLYSLSHFEYDGHTVHMLTQWRLPPSLTRTIESSLFLRRVHCPWLQGYIDDVQTIFIILIMAGFFPREISYSSFILSKNVNFLFYDSPFRQIILG